MKKKAASKSVKATPRLPARQARGYTQLVKAISSLNTRMVSHVATAANQALVLRNWMVGAWIVEFEQHGADRAKYGERLLETLAEDLRVLGIKGMNDPRVLRECRTLYRIYPQIRGSLTREFELPGRMRAAIASDSKRSPNAEIAIRGSVTA